MFDEKNINFELAYMIRKRHNWRWRNEFIRFELVKGLKLFKSSYQVAYNLFII